MHRGVKPGNILLHLTGNAYITDFGLAKHSGGTDLTRQDEPPDLAAQPDITPGTPIADGSG